MSREWHEYSDYEEICCPHCNEKQNYEQESIADYVTYWGEGNGERKCQSCNKTFWMREHVKRTWTLGRTYDGSRFGDHVEAPK